MMNYELRGKGNSFVGIIWGDGQCMVQVWIDYGRICLITP